MRLEDSAKAALMPRINRWFLNLIRKVGIIQECAGWRSHPHPQTRLARFSIEDFPFQMPALPDQMPAEGEQAEHQWY
jgi:hypothetical protein